MKHVKPYDDDRRNVEDYFIDLEDSGYENGSKFKLGEYIVFMVSPEYKIHHHSGLDRHSEFKTAEDNIRKVFSTLCKISKSKIHEQHTISFKISITRDPMGYSRKYEYLSCYIENNEKFIGFRENAGKLIPHKQIIAADAFHQCMKNGDNYYIIITGKIF